MKTKFCKVCSGCGGFGWRQDYYLGGETVCEACDGIGETPEDHRFILLRNFIEKELTSLVENKDIEITTSPILVLNSLSESIYNFIVYGKK